MINKKNKNGSALVVALLFTTIFLYIGITLISIISKEFVRLNILEQSQTAFTIADTVLECVILYDSRFRLFERTEFFGVGGGKLICPFYKHDFATDTAVQKTLVSYPVGVINPTRQVNGVDIIGKEVTPTETIHEYYLVEDLTHSNPCARFVLKKQLVAVRGGNEFIRTDIEVFGYATCEYAESSNDSTRGKIITGEILRTIRTQK